MIRSSQVGHVLLVEIHQLGCFVMQGEGLSFHVPVTCGEAYQQRRSNIDCEGNHGNLKTGPYIYIYI